MTMEKKMKLEGIEIPEKHKTYDEKINYLTEYINEKSEVRFPLIRRTTESIISTGRALITFRKVSKGEGKKWPTEFKRHLPHLAIRTAQRYMKLAKNIDLNRYPALIFLLQSQLYELAKLAGNDISFVNLFENYGIDIYENTDFDDDEVESEGKMKLSAWNLEILKYLEKRSAIDELKEKADELIRDLKNKASGKVLEPRKKIAKKKQLKHGPMIQIANSAEAAKEFQFNHNLYETLRENFLQ
jgi:hypothetical protein